MQNKIIVLGAGLIGRAIAIDLKKSGHVVRVADKNPKNLSVLHADYEISVCQCNVEDSKELEKILDDHTLVIGALPGEIGFRILKEVIHHGKDIIDISFCPENYLELDGLAGEKGVSAVVDMGVAPGMCNAILGYHDARMKVESYKCVVGGLPLKREWPLEYKSSWSPIDCIEEYIRPARFMQNGQLVEKPALSDAELINFEETGTLEEWNSDGLRSLLTTMKHIPNMIEKTLRYPGTIDYIRALRDLGYFSYNEIDVRGKKIRPIDLTAALLFPKWKLEKGEKEITIMNVSVKGSENGQTKQYVYDLYDEYDPSTDTLSMSRTTGYTCTAVAELMLRGKIRDKGILPPEKIGADQENFTFLLDYLKARNVVYTLRET